MNKPRTRKTRKQRTGPLEAAILKGCLDWLEARGYMHWRVYTGPVVRGGGKVRKHLAPNPTKGFPDICGIFKNRPGVLFACECKTDVGKATEHQTDWIRRLKAAGAVAFIARSPEQMAAILTMEDRDDGSSAKNGHAPRAE